MSSKNGYFLILKHGALVLLIAFTLIQFLLILRHKSPYVSDSYFYKHIYYQIKGYSFDEAREKVITQVDLKDADEIALNIFTNSDAYKNSYSLFTKRPLYPVMAAFLSLVLSSEYLSFLIPILLAYLASILLAFYLFEKGLSYFFAIFALFLFVSFYPFLDWSTYFLTDTIGLFFWLMMTVSIYRFLKEGKKKWFILFALIMGLSLSNREQTLLAFPMTTLLYLLLKVSGFKSEILKRNRKILLTAFLFVVSYILISKLLSQKTIIDTIVYTMNSYGLYSYNYNATEISTYLLKTAIVSHVAFVQDLVRHHFWFTFFAIAKIGILKTLLFEKKKKLTDIVILSSGIAAYLAIFIYPVLSYRFFFPTAIMVAYFASKFIFEFMQKRSFLIGAKNI